MIGALYRYPIKGLSAEPLQRMTLTAGQGIEGDRAIAIARTPDNFDPSDAQAQPKHKFLMLMRDEALAALETHYDDTTGQLAVKHGGAEQVTANLRAPEGRATLETFFARYLNDPKLMPKVVSAPGHKFTDISVVSPQKMRAVSLINTASIEALEQAEGRSFHPLRFRANIYFSGAPAWAELDWVGQDIMIGGAKARVVLRTKRCAATQVNPLTAERDANVPALIKKHFDHFDMGVYAEIETTAEVSIGDAVTLV